MSDWYFDFTVKIIIAGEISVGKTSLLNNFKDLEEPTDTLATIGTEYYSFIQEYKGKQVKINIWDTSGQEWYRSITKQYFQGANGIILVYDVTWRDTFNSLKRWVQDIQMKSSENVMIIVLGNKIDQNEKREVSVQEGREFSNQNGTLFMETSALYCYTKDVKKAFQTLIDLLSDQIFQRETQRFTQELEMSQKEIVKILEPIDTKKKCC